MRIGPSTSVAEVNLEAEEQSEGEPERIENILLRVRKLIPPLSVRETSGRMVHAWDYKQKWNLVIAFLDVHCGPCEALVRDLVNHAPELPEKGARALLIFPEQHPSRLCDSLPDGMIMGSDVRGRGIREFLGADALSAHGLERRSVLVTDRYGEIAGLWTAEKHEFPAIQQILSALNLAEIACEECSVPIWPVDA